MKEGKRFFILRGDVILVDFGERVGSEQSGIRPAVVVQNNMGNKFSPVITVIPMTTVKSKFDKTHVSVEFNNNTSYILCEQITTIDKSRVINDKLGNLGTDVMNMIKEKLFIQLDF